MKTPRAGVALALVAAAPVAYSQCTSAELQFLSTNGGERLDRFGGEVEVDGVNALVGADGEDDVGTVYSYRNDGDQWVLEQEIRPADATSLSVFGSHLASQGSALMVGDNFADDTGVVYVYELVGTQWNEVQRLVGSDAEAFDSFGGSVALSGDVAVFGAFNANGEFVDEGAAYLFRHDGSEWTEQQKLPSSTPGAFDQYGFAVAVDGGWAAVTATGDDDVAQSAGAVYLFRDDGSSWVEEQKLVAADGGFLDLFGWELALSGETLVASAPNHDEPFEDAGAVYVFELEGSTWIQVQKLSPSDAVELGNFGWSLDLDGDRMAVGSSGSVDGAGAVYVFQHDGTRWVESHRHVSGQPAGGGELDDNLGRSVALSGTTVLAGAPFADGPVADETGTAFVFDSGVLGLSVEPESVPAGGTLTMRACGGLTGGGVRFRLRELDGQPTAFTVGTGQFGADGVYELLVPVPQSASGSEVSFQADGFWQPGVAGSSIRADVTVE